jgi:hypothetical protein
MAFSPVDLTETWEVPAGSAVITSSKVACTSHNKQTQGWAHFDLGMGNEVGGSAGSAVGCRFEFIRSSGTTFYVCGLVAFSSQRCGPVDAFQNNPTVAHMFGIRINSDAGSAYKFYIIETDGTSFGSTAQTGTIGNGTRYYCTVAFDPVLGAFGRVIFTIRTGSHAGSIVETMTRDLTAAHDPWRFFTPWLGSADFGSGSRSTSFDIENVEIEGFTVMDSTTLEPTAYWPSEAYNDPKYTEVDGGSVVFTRTASQLLATDQDKQDDDYVWMELGNPVSGDFIGTTLTSVVGVSDFWRGLFVALATAPGSAEQVNDANEAYLGFGADTGGDASPNLWISEADGAGVRSNTVGATGLTTGLVYWTFALDYDGGVGNGQASLAARSGHPENARSLDEVTHDLDAQQVYTHFMVYSAAGDTGAGTRKADITINSTSVSFSTSDTPITTLPPTTAVPTTAGPTTIAPTTIASTTIVPTTVPPTGAPVTPAPVGAVLRPNLSAVYLPASDTLHVRAWVEDEFATTVNSPINFKRSDLELLDEEGRRIDYAQGAADPAGSEYVQFEMTNLQISADHNYVLRVKIAMPSISEAATGTFPMPTEG